MIDRYVEKGIVLGTEPVSDLIKITMFSQACDFDLHFEGPFLMEILDARNRRAREAAPLPGADALRVELAEVSWDYDVALKVEGVPRRIVFRTKPQDPISECCL